VVSVARDFCGGAACCAALSSGSAWRGLREKVFGRRMASAVSSRVRVRGSANTGLNVKKRWRREWLWKQRAAMPVALWSAPSVSALTCVAGHSFSSARVACCRSSASFLARDRSSVQSVGRPMHPKCGSQPPTTALPHLPRRLKFRSSATASSAASGRLARPPAMVVPVGAMRAAPGTRGRPCPRWRWATVCEICWLLLALLCACVQTDSLLNISRKRKHYCTPVIAVGLSEIS